MKCIGLLTAIPAAPLPANMLMYRALRLTIGPSVTSHLQYGINLVVPDMPNIKLIGQSHHEPLLLMVADEVVCQPVFLSYNTLGIKIVEVASTSRVQYDKAKTGIYNINISIAPIKGKF